LGDAKSVDREEAEGAGHEALHVPAEEQHREVAWTKHARQRFARAQRGHERTELDVLEQSGLDRAIRGEPSHALKRVPKRQQIEIAGGRAAARTPIPRLKSPPS
jgi:hypothetical protein